MSTLYMKRRSGEFRVVPAEAGEGSRAFEQPAARAPELHFPERSHSSSPLRNPRAIQRCISIERERSNSPRRALQHCMSFERERSSKALTLHASFRGPFNIGRGRSLASISSSWRGLDWLSGP
ncbi:unnamed protein product [Prorocentrum cordatum]|uniref:Uncharacterized protein n=1 Tax=Prorocentrum cordatum TaxID=2364126 RepID=A0ABN9UL72_9DINO|nr:unnamed protein product [Polarella glacialis]